jgi:hypothetical protein
MGRLRYDFDGRLYTHQSFKDEYGEEQGIRKWGMARRCPFPGTNLNLVTQKDGVPLLDARSQEFAHMPKLQQMLIDIKREEDFDFDAAYECVAKEIDELERYLRSVAPEYDRADVNSPILVSKGEEADKKMKYALTTRYMCVCVCVCVLSACACVSADEFLALSSTQTPQLCGGEDLVDGIPTQCHRQGHCSHLSMASRHMLSPPNLSKSHICPIDAVDAAEYSCISLQEGTACVVWDSCADNHLYHDGDGGAQNEKEALFCG